MLKVVFDYKECVGAGACVEVCPAEILEVSENNRWCKPVDDEVRNKEAVKRFYDEVNDEKEQIDIEIENIMPECLECYSCEYACPEDAISIEPKLGFEDTEVEEDEDLGKYRARLKGE